ncbi:MAG: PQQ-like beta-propeller repeat protein [Planctomycetota bacterium]|nr:PQQ-like beta-propeller repeat protein [Planctomycetota bacterium]
MWKKREAVWLVLAICAGAAGSVRLPAAAEGDWPQFLGPNRDGIAAGGPQLLNAWPKSGPKLLWKSDPLPAAPSWGIGSPVVAGGKVYTFSCVFQPQSGIAPIDAELLASLQEKKQGHEADMEWIASLQGKEVKTYHEFERLLRKKWYNYTHGHWCAKDLLAHAKKLYKKNQAAIETLTCLDAATGKELWRKEFDVTNPPSPAYEGEGYGFSGVPAIYKDKLCFAGASGVYCLDLKKNGDLVWQAKGEGTHSSPLVWNGVVYVLAQELAAYDLETGQERWRQPAVKCDSTCPGVWTNEGQTYLLCPLGNYSSVACIDAASGKVRWKVPSTMYGVKPTPMVSGDIMVIRGGNGSEGFRITPDKAEKIWVNKESGDAGSTPVVFRDSIYVCTHHYATILVDVLNLKTGVRSFRQNARTNATCSTPIVADEKVFVLDSDGGLYGFKATPERYEEVGYVKTGAAKCSSLALANGRVYVRLKDAIACYDLTEAGNR